MHREHIAVLSSGGLDSCILISHLARCGRTVQPIYVRSGLVWEAAELAALLRYQACEERRGVRKPVILDLPMGDVYAQHWSITGELTPDRLAPDEDVYLPGRNGLLLLKAALWCVLNGISALALGALGTSPFRDATPEFLDQLRALLRFYTDEPPKLLLPFRGMDKQQVMQLGGDFPLELTFSCLSPLGSEHCGNCNKCEERRQAFAQAGRRDSTSYAA